MAPETGKRRRLLEEEIPSMKPRIISVRMGHMSTEMGQGHTPALG